MIILTILIKYKEAIMGGLFVTLKMCLWVWFLGMIIGSLLGMLGSRFKKIVGKIVQATSFLVAATPILVLLFWFHFPLQSMFHLVIDPFYTAVLVLSIINVIAVADMVRNALDDFPQQYMLAAQVCGLSPQNIARYIQVPLVFRQVLPSILFLQVNVLHLTLFTSLISVEEIFRVTQHINSLEYRPVEIYSTLALFFIAISSALFAAAGYLRKRFTRNYSEK